MIYLRFAKSQAEILEQYSRIKEMPVTDLSPETILGRCLTYQYKVLLGFEEDVNKVLVIYQDNFPQIFVVGVYGRKVLSRFLNLFYQRLDSAGYFDIRAQSTLPEEKFTKSTRLVKLWTVYGRRIKDVLE